MVESILERSAVIMGEKMESRWSGVEGSGGSGSGGGKLVVDDFYLGVEK